MIRKIKEGFTPKHYLVELLFGFSALFGFYLIIAWSGYSPLDSAWSVSSYQTEVINKAGKLGAWIIDLFFVFFGDIGNLLPFLLLIAPIYFIRTKRVDSLTWTRFGLRMFGFCLLMIGLTLSASLLLENGHYYLSGGVLGASLVKALFPLLGQFGLLAVGVFLSLAGFIFCSGASLIRLLMKFYHWLTMQNEEKDRAAKSATAVAYPPAQESAEPESHEEVAVASSPTQEIQQTRDSEAQGEAEAFRLQTEGGNVININIVGLNSGENTEEKMPAFEPFSTGSDFGSYRVNDMEQLPEVKFSPADTQEYKDNPAEEQLSSSSSNGPEFLQSHRNMLVEAEAGYLSAFGTDSMPQVKLAPTQARESGQLSFEGEAVTETPVTQADVSALAAEFARQEAEREQERLARMQSVGVVDEIPEPVIAEDAGGLRTISIDEAIKLFGDQKPLDKPSTEMPSLDLLDKRSSKAQEISAEEIRETSQRIEQQLRNFNIKATVKDVLVGPVVTRYELELQPGVKASKVTGIDTDLARALMFRAIRVAESIPDKPYIGIETPNDHRQIVSLRDVLDSDEFRHSKALLPMALGKDISGKPVVIDLAKTPHLLVAGSTGSGKSVGINTMILSLLYRVKPEEVKFIMIDPKVVELSIYNGIPHLLTEVVTDMKKAANALRWCVEEMERRYQLLAKLRVRNIEGFNDRIDEYRAENIAIPDPLWKPGDSMDGRAPILEKLSYIVVIVDEFADLMMVAGKQVEELIARLTQKARAVGIHVILATQRPSVDVITGLIKSNIPSRIAFTVVQRNDSRTILDQNGAEALLGRGDMLYLGNGTTDLVRVHGAFMSDDEVVRVANDWRARGKPQYIAEILEGAEDEDNEGEEGSADSGELDALFDEVTEFVVRTGTTSVSSIQRRFRVGFNRAARIMDQLEEQGIVSEVRNGKREVLAPKQDY
ncbi:DNA translocase FtsK [Mesocricetibacter intestinalis]|uniref:DNA translocase FtsK n=1 Tax=Mesocricetibacter intestinalis TaxID=1521930 RepID=A0A4R6V7G6_9PAST|nr:DNA translocase FtsK [Mesocricetibacter intestinalis]TDQ57039.1 DNA translocase FtsK [Mesocricetibacter intestinalis]